MAAAYRRVSTYLPAPLRRSPPLRTLLMGEAIRRAVHHSPSPETAHHVSGDSYSPKRPNHRLHGSYIDTLYGSSADVVKFPALTAFLCNLNNWHGLRGEPYDGDADDDGYAQLSELVDAVDSLYEVAGVYFDDALLPPYTTPDTVQVLDSGGLASGTELVRRLAPECLTFRESGSVKMKVTNGGYCYLEGAVGDGTASGLLFGDGGVSLTSNGDLVWGDSLRTHQEAYFDSAGDLSDGLLFRSNCGEVVQHIAPGDTVLLRGWVVEEFPEF